jgi:sarcosine oxidase subunit alpha
MQSRRLDSGGLIDRSATLYFSFNGRLLQGHDGDSLASALLANGINPVARSFRYHRPRGILCAGLEEPNALVSLALPNGVTVPNLKATELRLQNGMTARSQNCWPSVDFDLGSLLQIASGLLSAGFYYKTFMWPPQAWQRVYEKLIRRIAGQGRVSLRPDPRSYDRRNAFCDLLIVGSGPAGLAAACAAADSGKSVLLLEQDALPGGSTLWDQQRIDDLPAAEWRQRTLKTLVAHPNVRIRCNTLAFGHYDHGRVMALESHADGVAAISWRIRCRRLLLACGATERPLVFPGNDRPGIMLAASVRQYIYRYAVAPGRRAMLAIGDAQERDATRRAMLQSGIEIAGELRAGEVIVATRGRRRLRGVVCDSQKGARRVVDCDLLCVSAGWNPNAQLAAQMGARAQHADPTRVPRHRFQQRSLPRGGVDTILHARRRAAGAARAGRAERAGTSRQGVAGDRHRGAGSRLSRRARAGLRRPAERRHARRSRTGGARGLRPGRAGEALHHARHGHRPGQDQLEQRHPRNQP